MRKLGLTGWILIALLTGVAVGWWENGHASPAEIERFSAYMSAVTDKFLWLIRIIIPPLVFFTLSVGIAKLGDIRAVGRIGGKTLLWFFGASLLSLLLGLIVMNALHLGSGINLPLPASASAAAKAVNSAGGGIIGAMKRNLILQIVLFSVFFGIGMASAGEKARSLVRALDAVGRMILRITAYVMYLAPAAALTAIASVLAWKGPELLYTYGKFILSFYLTIIGLWLLLLLIASFFIGRRVIDLAFSVKDMVLLAFSTASSEAAFPKLIRELENFGCPPRIVSFVLPLGYSFNLDGSMLYMSFASLFIAQAYGVPLTLGQEFSMLLVLMLTSKGVAGVPRAALVVIAGTLSLYNIPQQGMLLLLGIDQILDMARSATNVLGNSIAAAVVSKWEGELGQPAVDLK